MGHLSDLEVDMASGGDGVSTVLSDTAIAFGAMSAIGSGLAALLTPASLPLGGFAVMTGIMSVGFAYMANHISSHPYAVHGKNRR